MHDVRVALDGEALGDLHAATRGDAADIVAAKVEQHQVFGALLWVRDQALGVGLIRLGCGAARKGSGDRANGDDAVAHADEDFGARSRDLEAAEVHVEHEGRRVEAAQRAIERERRALERRRETLAGHDLEDVTGVDVALGLLDHFEIARLGGVGCEVDFLDRRLVRT